MTALPSDAIPTSQRLAQLTDDAPQETVTLGWVLEQMQERAFGLFLLVLALPCCIPFVYGLPQVVAMPLMLISVQIVFGRKSPWLPERLAGRTVSAEGLQGLSLRAGPWLRRIEAVSRPRLTALTRPPLDRFVGLALVAFSASILVPLPLTNTVPGFAVVVVAMGLLQRDGILVILGALLGTAWIAALVLTGASLISLIMGWVGL
ncbi:exopolysaccharide biosynthesis protein [Rhodobacteraceae bacterium N5(2021)]|uniref:Exopolysaccharide biosynthesis protein n=1 Tax=Gymnodinialimonas phycosphaerae TaxID=2841589 RepID=A0A975TXP3_9RHOB|nr:exopolysaccharide biosynthesis protein [Gymnodinialimonas phycosphaerae]MBY4892337.1 exopolysaccharide biosynthesis protein [Gymnodinialimonas phycosphaerae]